MELKTRPYFCATCTLVQVSTGFPRGWYVLSRSAGPVDDKIKLGLYCSIECLVERIPILKALQDAYQEQSA